ncbi:hypothetical protein TCAL_07806 [Tigriopus californicus]|uniref:GST C-terminal domain-containing protein n=2 Tax=Tigriopus californicus TaxID=6832 RepID=A0A553NQU4_TIGCA|nr:hypothetical protein TCAL_07806 [Tigriopus californicus]
MLVWLMIRQTSIFTQTIGKKSCGLVLHSITLSHYVDKVRWSMEHVGIEFDEEEDIGIFGVFFMGRWVPALYDKGSKSLVSNSADILRYLYGKFYTQSNVEEFLRPSKEAVELEKKLDLLGLDLRRYMYYHLLVASPLPHESALTIWGLHSPNVPEWQKYLLKAMMPLLRAFLCKVANITPEGALDGWKKSEKTFKEIDALLSDGRAYLLNTNHPTFVDVTFASLAAILVFPDNYGGPRLVPESRPQLKFASADYQKHVKSFRQTPSGKFILKMYKERSQRD